MLRKYTIFILVIAFLSATVSPVVADIGDIGLMDSACQSSTNELKRLCEIVNDEFRAKKQDCYIHLGEEFYLVPVSNAPRVSQGLYVANTNTGQIKMFGGYGLPTIGEIRRLADGTLIIGLSQMSMGKGQYWKDESVLQVRTNPISKTPYLIKQVISAVVDVSEEIEGFCEDPENADDPNCVEKSEWGKKQITTIDEKSTADLLRAHEKALVVYKSKDRESGTPFGILEKAGVRKIIDRQPSDMTLQQYVNVLNDYAFFAYKYGQGRTELSVEILDKVIRLAPNRTPAYLNMAQALEYLAKYASVPLGPETIEMLKASANRYMEKYKSMKKGAQ